MGPQEFEKAWIKQLKGFNETKVFFFHDRDKTTVKYIKGNRLLGVEMYRRDYEIEYWLGHFQHYLDTGVFDTNAYWVIYDGAGEEDTVFPIPMKLKNKLWSVHSPEHNKFMRDERAKEGRQGKGFKQKPRP